MKSPKLGMRSETVRSMRALGAVVLAVALTGASCEDSGEHIVERKTLDLGRIEVRFASDSSQAPDHTVIMNLVLELNDTKLKKSDPERKAISTYLPWFRERAALVIRQTGLGPLKKADPGVMNDLKERLKASMNEVVKGDYIVEVVVDGMRWLPD